MCDIKKPMFGLQSPEYMLLKKTPLAKYVPMNPLTPPKAVSDMQMKLYSKIPDNKTRAALAAFDPVASGVRDPIGSYQSYKDFGRDGSENAKTVRKIS